MSFILKFTKSRLKPSSHRDQETKKNGGKITETRNLVDYTSNSAVLGTSLERFFLLSKRILILLMKLNFLK